MNQKQLLSLYGLKWNPFSPDIPHEALIVTPKIENFLWRVETLVLGGGFAMVTGDSGLGKSVTMRLLERRLSQLTDVVVGEISRPQSGIGDFYRELGNVFGIELRVANKFGGFRALREKWKSHIETTLFRPVLFIDEAQEMSDIVLSELRLLGSMKFDSQIILAVVLGGDARLPQKFRSADLIPLGNRIRTRLVLEPYTKDELLELLTSSLALAGAPTLMTKGLMSALTEHALGNPRVMNGMANEILMLGAKNEAANLDEKLFFEAIPIQRKAGVR